MHEAQDRLEFQIETPNDQELALRFDDELCKIEESFGVPSHLLQANVAKKGKKTRNRKSRQQKKQERIDRSTVKES